MLCVAAAAPAGYNVLDTNWRIANEIAAQHGRTMNPADLRLMAPIHVAESREQAVEEVNRGFGKYLHYAYSLRPDGPTAFGLPPEIAMTNVEELHRTGKASIGTPDDAVALIERFWAKTGGFGAILILAHNWANFEATKKSFEMFARYVMPKFAMRNNTRDSSLDWIRGQREEFGRTSKAAAMKLIDQHLARELAKKQSTAE
jgi:limonene 1,2-monooxygenase